MARFFYDRLTALDSSFLVLEKPSAYMHVVRQSFQEILRVSRGVESIA